MEQGGISKGYQEPRTVTQLSCSILQLLVKNYTQNPQLSIGIQYFHPSILYTGMCGYCKQRIRENSEIGFPDGEGRAAKFSSGGNYIFKTNAVMFPGVLQQVQVHTLY